MQGAGNDLQRRFVELEALNRTLTPSSSGFFSCDDFPWVSKVEARWQAIRAECDHLLDRVSALPNFQDVLDDQKELTTDDGWKVLPFYAYGSEFEPNLRRCPQTAQALQLIPGLTSAMFSVLRGPKNVPPHRGPFNGVLRYHLALRIPGPPERCRIRVGSEWRTWSEGRSMIFDDTLEHEVENRLSGPRAVLFVDFLRPAPPHVTQMNEQMVTAFRHSSTIRDMLKKLDRWNLDF